MGCVCYGRTMLFCSAARRDRGPWRTISRFTIFRAGLPHTGEVGFKCTLTQVEFVFVRFARASERAVS